MWSGWQRARIQYALSVFQHALSVFQHALSVFQHVLSVFQYVLSVFQYALSVFRYYPWFREAKGVLQEGVLSCLFECLWWPQLISGNLILLCNPFGKIVSPETQLMNGPGKFLARPQDHAGFLYTISPNLLPLRLQ